MTDPDVSGWQPAWQSGADALRTHAARLRGLRGDRITATWIVWNVELDEWFADLPVVLDFAAAGRLELCWQKFDDLSITWNTVDVTRTPRAWVDWPLEWRSGAHPALRVVDGSVVTEVMATEHRLTTRRVDGPACETATWLIGGVWLRTAAGGLHVFNALDENGLGGEPLPGPELRLQPI